MPTTLKITSDFHWIGALDPQLRTFDIVMTTEFGTTYNAYILKTTDGDVLFETVKDKCFDEYLEKLQCITNLEHIKYLIVDHTEPDHAGSIAKLLEHIPNLTIVGSFIALKYLSAITNRSFKSLAVKDGDTLTIGNKTIQFMSVPQLHWPDTIYSYIKEEKILVTCDSFGAHYSDARIFKNQLESSKEEEYISAYKYYYDMIMSPFKPFMVKALDKIESLELDYICPGHGMILDKSNMNKYIDLYRTWSMPERPSARIIIAYVSAYGYTKRIAESIYEGIKMTDYPGQVEMLDLETVDTATAVSKINDSEGLLLGSPTILADALPPIWQVMISLNPILHRHLHVGCFGSYGWSGEGVSHMAERLKSLKCPMPVEPLSIHFNPSEEEIAQAIQFGKTFAQSFSY